MCVCVYARVMFACIYYDLLPNFTYELIVTIVVSISLHPVHRVMQTDQLFHSLETIHLLSNLITLSCSCQLE